MGDLEGLTSQLISSSFGGDVKLGVPSLDAECTVGLNALSVARNLDKPFQNKLKNKNKKSIGSKSLKRYRKAGEKLTTYVSKLND